MVAWWKITTMNEWLLFRENYILWLWRRLTRNNVIWTRIYFLIIFFSFFRSYVSFELNYIKWNGVEWSHTKTFQQTFNWKKILFFFPFCSEIFISWRQTHTATIGANRFIERSYNFIKAKKNRQSDCNCMSPVRHISGRHH